MNECTQSLRSMTFNIRQDRQKDGVNNWIYRKGKVASVIRFHHCDIVGIQEAFFNQMQDLEELLPEYGWVGVGRDDGDKEGEFAAIFYLKNRFEVIDGGTFWLSETPNAPGQKGWDADCVRICTWAKFIDKTSKKIFYFYNTHYDHVGQIAMVQSSYLLLNKINNFAKDYPVVVVGDFNNTEDCEAYKILVGENGLRNSRYISKFEHHGPSFTYHGFKANELMKMDVRLKLENSHELIGPIDFIFVNEKSLEKEKCQRLSLEREMRMY